ncbi:tRNA lysidine(34) synthetase TilS [bacterium]|nr:tRNA lysidine(34) synthetase TilS [bacterium]
MSARSGDGIDPIARIEGGVGAFFVRHPETLGKGLLVAYSGGVDSTTLLAALAALKPCAIRAVHVSHGLRPAEELRAERAFVEKTCLSLGVALTVATIRPGAVERLAKEREIGVEAAARELRYHILRRTAARFGLGTLCTAHNADDQLETLLARFIASSSADGLAGIRGLRRLRGGLFLARPLLFAPREDIERYAEAKGLGHSADSTNAADRYARNKIRHKLIPLLDGGFPGWRSGVLGSAEKLRRDRHALRQLLRRALADCGFEKGLRSASFSLDGFLAQPEVLKVRILALGVAATGAAGRLSYRALRSAARSLDRGAGAADLPGARLLVRGEKAEILPILDFRGEDKYFFQIPSEGLYRCGPISLELRWESRGGRDAPSPLQGLPEPKAFLLEGAFSFPLLVRSRKPGDAILCAGTTRRLDDILSSWRLEPSDRDAVPIVEDRDGIVAVLASAIERPLAGARRDKFRDYGGDASGRRLYIGIKGV